MANSALNLIWLAHLSDHVWHLVWPLVDCRGTVGDVYGRGDPAHSLASHCRRMCDALHPGTFVRPVELALESAPVLLDAACCRPQHRSCRWSCTRHSVVRNRSAVFVREHGLRSGSAVPFDAELPSAWLRALDLQAGGHHPRPHHFFGCDSGLLITRLESTKGCVLLRYDHVHHRRLQ